jgi:hypothetical protein
MFTYIIGIGILLLIVYINNRNNRKIGRAGEQIIKNILSNLEDKFTVINNLKFKRTQIDHLVICHECKLVFVIETKLWGGVISGGRYDSVWQQTMNNQIKYMKNPLLQNRYHCQVVRKYYRGYHIYSIVVFVNNNNIPQYQCIVKQNELINYINKTTNTVSNRYPMDIQTVWSSQHVKR